MEEDCVWPQRLLTMGQEEEVLSTDQYALLQGHTEALRDGILVQG